MSIDFPRAWEIAASVEREYHHNECSFNVSRGGVLCDCDVIHKHPEYTDKINFYGAGGIAIQQQEPSLLDDDSLAYQIGEIGNQIHNLGCEYQNDEELADRLAEFAHLLWKLQQSAAISKQRPAPDVAGLVEALEKIEAFQPKDILCGSGWKEWNRAGGYAASIARDALAAHRSSQSRNKESK